MRIGASVTPGGGWRGEEKKETPSRLLLLPHPSSHAKIFAFAPILTQPEIENPCKTETLATQASGRRAGVHPYYSKGAALTTAPNSRQGPCTVRFLSPKIYTPHSLRTGSPLRFSPRARKILGRVMKRCASLLARSSSPRALLSKPSGEPEGRLHPTASSSLKYSPHNPHPHPNRSCHGESGVKADGVWHIPRHTTILAFYPESPAFLLRFA